LADCIPTSEEQPKPIRESAWKAQLRLCARYRKLARAGKAANVVTAAIAREPAGFIWAIARRVPPAAGWSEHTREPIQGRRQPPDTLLPVKAGGAAAVRRTLDTTICRVADLTQVF
jgi:hypothetical protein